MQWVLKILRKHLENERKWLHATAHDAKSKAGVQFAKERIPQLEKAIELLKKNEPTTITQQQRTKKPIKNQISLFQLLNP